MSDPKYSYETIKMAWAINMETGEEIVGEELEKIRQHREKALMKALGWSGDTDKEKNTMSKQQLQAARDLVHNGWVKGASEITNPAGGKCYCLSGALAAANAPQVAWNKVKEVIPGGGIVTFNDAPETTKEDVLKVLDRAIALV